MSKLFNILNAPQHILLYTILLLQVSHNSLLDLKSFTPFYEVVLVFIWCSLLSYSALSSIQLIIFGLIKDVVLLQPLGFSCMELLCAKYFIYFNGSKMRDSDFLINLEVFVYMLFTVLSLRILVFMFWKLPIIVLLKISALKFISTLMLYLLFYFVVSRVRRTKTVTDYV